MRFRKEFLSIESRDKNTLNELRRIHAVKLVEHGFALIPLMPCDKRPYFEMLRLNGKGQPSWKIYADEPPVEEEVLIVKLLV